MNSRFAIKTQALSKDFPTGPALFSTQQSGKTVVDRVSLTVEWEEIVGLMGPNGAGKSTLFKILATLIKPSSGSGFVAGHPLSEPAAILPKIGLVIPDERSFYWRLTGRQNLRFFAALHRHFGPKATERVAEVLDLVDLAGAADQRFDRYSSGMRQRLALARGLLHRPQILLLDEPSRALDPEQQAKLHQLISSLNREEKTTFLIITHDIAEAKQLCHRVHHMENGQMTFAHIPPYAKI